MTSKTAAVPAPKPLRLPPVRDLSEGKIAQRLGGHVTNPQWLPDWPELVDAKREHARLLEQAEAALARLTELEATFRREDLAHVESLKTAARAGEAMPADERTSDVERAERLEAVTDEVWAVLAVLADVVDETLALIRNEEDTILGRLRGERAEAENLRREAERQLTAAKTVEWRLHQQAAWLMNAAEKDGPFSRQPSPTPSPPPAMFSRVVLERPWHRERPPASEDMDTDADAVSVMIDTREPAA